jgi:hypothetical protein
MQRMGTRAVDGRTGAQRARAWTAIAVTLAAAGGTGSGCLGSRPLTPGGGAIDASGGGTGGRGGDAGTGFDAAGPGPADSGIPDVCTMAAACDGAVPLPGGWQEERIAPDATAALAITDGWTPGDGRMFFAGNTSDGSNLAQVLVWPGWGQLLRVGAPRGTRARISGTGPDNIWITTGDELYFADRDTVHPFDDGWRALVAAAGETEVVLTDVHAASHADLWVLGRTFVLQRLPRSWRVFRRADVIPPEVTSAFPRFSFTFHALWVNGPNDVWIGGGTDYEGSTMDPSLLVHWDGTAWTRVPVALWLVDDIWAASPDDVWVVNAGIQATSGMPLMFHYDGTTMNKVSVDGLSHPTLLSNLWGRSTADVWAGGQAVAHWDGIAWRRITDVPAALTPPILVTGDATSVWLVGSGPSFFRARR